MKEVLPVKENKKKKVLKIFKYKNKRMLRNLHMAFYNLIRKKIMGKKGWIFK